ncbi:MAG: phytoene/squalene synthase family protein [Hyphomicrobiaceae bacterium]
MRSEPDRYVAATLSPPGLRAGLAAVAAFAGEIGRIPATVSEPMLGDIRLQWWRDAIEGAARGERTGHPVAEAIGAAVERHGLDRELLLSMIDARELDLSGGLAQDDAGLAAYLGATDGHPFRLALAILGVVGSEGADLATHAGLAYGIARGLSRMPMRIHNGAPVLTAERLKAHGLDPARLADQPSSPDTEAAVEEVARELRSVARQAVAEARQRARLLTRAQRSALLPLVMVEPYFKAQSGCVLVRQMADVGPLERFARIGAAHLTGRL